MSRAPSTRIRSAGTTAQDASSNRCQSLPMPFHQSCHPPCLTIPPSTCPVTPQALGWVQGGLQSPPAPVPNLGKGKS